ncbi:response regulator transcription factor [Nocardioides caldifontis]|uniref:response regulator transcription factor n=1 Tax=Nocardioides caldifontis TaxID=2588938 RepID=UPI0011DF477A|nr:response regulator transcription factor [Nocardioides caldifontis]
MTQPVPSTAARLDTDQAGGSRVVVAEDDVLLRAGLVTLLQRGGFTVVGETGDATSLLQLVRFEVPDVVVTDIRMPPTHSLEGIEAATTIRRELPEVAVLVLSAHVEVAHAMELLADGKGIGYLLKSRVVDVDDFLDSVRRVTRGGSVVDPSLVQDLISQQRRDDPLAALSPRELEVLALMAEGRSNMGISQQLWVTPGTVEKHVKSIMHKLDLQEDVADHRRVRAVVAYLDAR